MSVIVARCILMHPKFAAIAVDAVEWQTSWNNSIGNKLLDSKLTICEYQSVVRNIRKEVVFARLRLGHTRVTHSYLYPGIQFRLPCTPPPQDNFSWVPNCSLGPPGWETKVSSKKFWFGLCEIAWFLCQPIANLRRGVCL